MSKHANDTKCDSAAQLGKQQLPAQMVLFRFCLRYADYLKNAPHLRWYPLLEIANLLRHRQIPLWVYFNLHYNSCPLDLHTGHGASKSQYPFTISSLARSRLSWAVPLTGSKITLICNSSSCWSMRCFTNHNVMILPAKQLNGELLLGSALLADAQVPII